MRNRILSIVLALSLIAVLFAALPTKAAIDYTGTVITTDTAGAADATFIYGEHVMVDVNVMHDGARSNETILVSLVRTTGGFVDSFTHISNDPVGGWYNSSQAPSHHYLDTGFDTISGDVQSYYVIVTLPLHGGIEIARSQIVVWATGMTLTPDPGANTYWPGEDITMRIVVDPTLSALVFYVQIVNETFVPTSINYTGQTATAGFWSKVMTISATMPDGTYWARARAQLDNNLWFNVSFDVEAFVFTVQTQRLAYLPGETADITYLLQDRATLSQITSGFTINYSVMYRNKTGNQTWQNSTLDVSKNLWEFVLPTNGTSKTSIALYSDVHITLTAKETGRSGDVVKTLTLQVGSITPTVAVDRNPANYVPGDTVVVTVNAKVLGWNLDGAKVVVTVARNGTEPISAYGATNLTTDLAGNAKYTFKLSESADLNTWTYIVTATVSKVGYSAARATQFDVGPNVYLNVAFDQSHYYGGQEATASFAPVLNNLPVNAGTIGYYFQLGSVILAVGNTTDTSATVMIPESSYGALSVHASAHINGVLVQDSASATVDFALLGLNPEMSVYRPGDTIVFQWTIVTGQASANLAYEVLDSNGVRVANGTPAFEKTGSFELVVPAAGPLLSTSYQATLRMTTPEGGYASDTATVNLVNYAAGSAMELKIWIGKSPYTSGQFAPGQKITIHYELLSYVKSAPSSIRLELTVLFDPNTYEFVVDSPTGTITYTIPKDAPVSPQILTVEAFDAANGGPAVASAASVFWVNNQASGWDSSVGGISAIDLVLLILLIIVIIMLIVVPYMKDRMARPKPPEAKPMELTPPAPSEPGKSPPSP